MRMKRAFLILAVNAFCLLAFAQAPQPVKWTYEVKAEGKGVYTIVFTAAIAPTWHTYSQFLAEGGPVPTSVTFDKDNKDITVNGRAQETGPKVHDGFDPVFEMNLKYFEEKMVMEQKVTVVKDTKVKVTVESMACDDHQCLPPEQVNFEIELKK